MLGLLLSRAGVDVHVLEKHDDFLRDFRGDTVHPTTQALLDQLGLLGRFSGIVRGRVDEISFGTRDRPILRIPLRRAALGSRFTGIALAPQWDLLDLLVAEASRSGRFRLTMGAEATGVVRRSDGSVGGIRYRTRDGEHEERAVLTVVADGRGSRLRDEVGSRIAHLGAPMDVMWLRAPRSPADGVGLLGVIGTGELAIAIDRRDYWQIAYLVPSGADERIRSEGIEAFRARLSSLLPLAPSALDGLVGFDEVKTLRVGLDRLERWHAPGILVIGDAAHTMSPIGGVGINLAIQDAVAAANELVPVLVRAQADPERFDKTLSPAPLERVTRRRMLPTRITQSIQRQAHNRVIAPALGSEDLRIPAPLAADLRHGGLIARLLVRVLVWGVRPERIRADLLSADPASSAPVSVRRAGRHRSAGGGSPAPRR